MMDGLTLLRQYNIEKKEIVEREGLLIFDKIAWPRKTRTNYIHRKAVSKAGGSKEYYTLESILFLLKNASLSHSLYVQRAGVQNIPVITLPDRKDLLAYLNGEAETSAKLDKCAPLEMGMPTATALKRPNEDTINEYAKKPKLILCLNDALSTEQITAIKAKRLARKRKTICTTEEITSRERVHSTRDMILQSSGKSFSNILQLVPQAYDRYKQEDYHSNTDIGGLDMMTRSFVGMPWKSVMESMIFECRPQLTTAFQKTPAVTNLKPDTKNDHGSKTPIVIVPVGTTSLISMFNVRDFLEGFRYVSLEEKKAIGAKREPEVTIQRRQRDPSHPHQTSSTPYRVTDTPLQLSASEWEQVVAVFVAGPTWQFKGWPGLARDGSPVDIFAKLEAYHLKFEELKCDPNIYKWSVRVLEISRSKRHLDKASVLHFWDTLDRFINKYKPELKH